MVPITDIFPVAPKVLQYVFALPAILFVLRVNPFLLQYAAMIPVTMGQENDVPAIVL